MTAADDESRKVIATNRKAFFNYEIFERAEAGVVAGGLGGEVDPRGRASTSATPSSSCAGASSSWSAAASAPTATATSRTTPRAATASCCCTGARSTSSGGKATEKGFTIVPLQAYFKNGRVKVEIGLARGKKAHDKRESIKRKDIERETRQAVRDRR